jgi:hypothetical protein
MFASLKSSLVVSLAAITLGLGLAASATPASAHGFGGGFHHGGGFHGGGFHGGFRHDHFGRWRRGYGWGFAGVDYGDDGCITYRPLYDEEGNVVGRRPINICE